MNDCTVKEAEAIIIVSDGFLNKEHETYLHTFKTTEEGFSQLADWVFSALEQGRVVGSGCETPQGDDVWLIVNEDREIQLILIVND